MYAKKGSNETRQIKKEKKTENISCLFIVVVVVFC